MRRSRNPLRHWLFLLAACSLIPAPRMAFSATAGRDPLLSAIEQLESSRDATCHSSASRFEDFLFGTPLGDAARSAHVEAQKRLARRLWSRASATAAAAGATRVEPSHLYPVLAEVAAVAQTESGLAVTFAGGTEVVIPAGRAAQYAGIAFSLRAILGVQQDVLMAGGPALLPLAPESIDALGQTLDVAALGALSLADREARRRSDVEIDPDRLREAWARVVPEPDVPGLAFGGEARPPEPPSAASRAQALALLDGIAAGKRSAYAAYNELGDAEARTRLLLFNISRFYARRPLAQKRVERREFGRLFVAELDRFAGELLRDASNRAAAAGHAVIRDDDAREALQQRVPHEIDEFEDVHVFPRLAEPDRVTLESFDCDSLRDFGMHWDSLLRAARDMPDDAPLPDPFAAEILAEAISQYGVLVLRVAGTIAGLDTDDARLLAPDLATAAAEVTTRARRHHAAPPRPKVTSRIASAAGPPAPTGDETWFRDATPDSGVHFVHRSSRWLGEFRHKQLKTPPTFSGGGIAAEDVDGDGNVDLLFVGGAGNALWLGDGSGRFRDATRASGLDWRRPDGAAGEPRSPLVADFDNDGRQDVLVTYVNDDHRLFRNLGGGRFDDVTATAGLGGSGLVGGPATVFDFDGDGLLDVYIAYFGDYLHGAIPTFDRDNRNALPNRLLRNLGGLRFEDVTEGSGAADTGWTQAVSHTDFDRDGRQDLIVANDYGRNAFLRNLGGGRFENVAESLGVNRAFHSMNVGVADLNDDDHPDVYISNLATLVKGDKYTFPDVDTPLHFDLRNLAGMMIKESDILWMSQVEDDKLVAYVPSENVERGETSTGWAWDAEFFDFDHDGDDDLYLVNGTNDYNTFTMVYRRLYDDGTSAEVLLNHQRESNVFFENDGGRLRNVSSRSGADFAGNSRSTAYADFDGDGDLDIAVNDFHGPARLLRNEVDKTGRGWLMLRLLGDPAAGSNRDAIGARITLTTEGGTRVRREIQGGSGYLSMNPKRQHFGLGSATRAEAVITWPNGAVQTLRGLEANRRYTVTQGGDVAVDGPIKAPSADPPATSRATPHPNSPRPAPRPRPGGCRDRRSPSPTRWRRRATTAACVRP